MQNETVIVAVGGSQYDSWRSVSVRASVKEVARSFKLVVAAEFGAAATNALFQDQTALTISAGGDLILTGYVDDRLPEIGPTGPATITVTGRSKGADAIDCSVDHTKPDYVNKTLLDFAQDQDAFGIGFSSDVNLDPIDRYRPVPGETLFRSLEILARDQGVTLAGQPDGGIKITRAGVSPPRQPGTLVEGVNIKLGSASHNSANRHSEVHVHGQAYKGVGKPNTQINAVAKDATIQRYRPLHVRHRGHATKARVNQHASHRRNREAGSGLTAIITTPGWRDDTGALWTPGNKVWTESDFLDLSQDMLIETVDYLQDDREGPRCVINLVDPRAHGGSGGGVNESGGGWGFDGSGASG